MGRATSCLVTATCGVDVLRPWAGEGYHFNAPVEKRQVRGAGGVGGSL